MEFFLFCVYCTVVIIENVFGVAIVSCGIEDAHAMAI